MQEAGIEPIAIAAKLARIGTSLPVEPVSDMKPLIAAFDFATFGRAPARFDLDELEALNARIVHELPFASVQARLPAGMNEADWAALRHNLRHVGDAAEWWDILHGHVERSAAAEDVLFLREAAAAATAIAWDEAPWNALVSSLKQSSGRAGKSLFLPLRRALTGRDHGPEMATLLPLIGRDEAIVRLQAAAKDR